MIILDTDVVSYIFNRDRRAAYYLEQMRGRRPLISFQTLEEAWFGAHRKNWGGRRREELALHLAQYEIVWADGLLVDVCVRLRLDRERAGRALNTADAWIAATAIRLSCPLATHDRDFSGIDGLELIQAPSS